ncbi:BglG family transcription antiterminator [Sporolactobacillus laevolacticus]|uniref:BglG family transcription antiterminator n=1 Tax=Sporolactobacillus laevolacticus TaxID=33018 RepID=UPI0025B4C04D|nr:PRD domain-containing protein [Sporolactobacillus laevolacticus]MDN3956638.1 PRD domain-containing protein [Sporolactobacillus laevolacticus]
MFMTNREKTILELLLKTSGRHSSLSIATYLQVSVRTVHRDLKNVEKILEPLGLHMIQSEDKSLHIQGPDKAIFKLAQELTKIEPVDLPAKERKLLLFLKLFHSGEPLKTGPLAKELNISATTLSGYLDELDDWIQDFNLTINRKRGVGINMIGTERSKRKALGNFYLFYFNEDLIAAIFQINHSVLENSQLVLHYFKARYLSEIERAMKKNIGNLYAELADSDYISFMIQVCIALQRYESGWSLNADSEHGAERTEKIEALPFIEKICAALTEQLSVELPEREKAFLATILKGSRLQSAESIYFDQVITGKAIKKLIQHVSQQLNIDLTSDFSLFQGLMAHLEPSLFRIRKDLRSFNPLTQQIKDQFPILFEITEKCLNQVFGQIRFPDDEIAYIVLHFGSALEQRKQSRSVRALIVCPTGIGASKMLAARLRKEMPELYSVSVASIHDMGQMNLKDYDVILSTVHLPKQIIPCLFVNPLLSKEDIEAIHHVSQQLSKNATGLNVLPVTAQKESKEVPNRNLWSLMDDIDHAQTAIREIMQHFSVIPIRHADRMETVVRQLTECVYDESLISDSEAVCQKLLERERMAGLAIPGTTMALFHCRDQSVRNLCFKVAHSDQPFDLAAMDGSKLPVSNFLLMIAPDNLHPIEQEVISTISSALVEDRESTLVFASANEAMIRAKLEAIFYRFLIHKF